MKPETITIQPFAGPVNGAIQLPGSKSITNRALILAALSQGTLTLEGALFSDDTRHMVTALQALGLTIDADEAAKTITVVGQGGTFPHDQAELYVGNAGTAARFLTAMLTLKSGGKYKLDGSVAMRKRPMRGLLDALQSIGAAAIEYHGEPGFFPFTLTTQGVPSGTWNVDASASSQILSALLMIAPLASGPVTVTLQGTTVSHPFIDMTLAMMAQFGQPATAPEGSAGSQEPAARSPHAVSVFSFSGSGHYAFPKGGYLVEPDATAASYFMMLPWVVGGRLLLRNAYHVTLQGDIRFTQMLGNLGAFFGVEQDHLLAEFRTPKRAGISENFNAISDTFLTLAAITPLLDSTTTISGIAHTRQQETDRIAAMAQELKKLGQHVTETADSLTVSPNLKKMRQLTANAPITLDTYDDHRVAMSFTILGCYDLHGDGRPWLTIHDPMCCAKTFPDFFDKLENLCAQS